MKQAREREFAEFVARESEALFQCAYLCHGQVGAAGDAVELALARAYVRWRGPASARLAALRLVSQPESARPFLPWRSRRRFDLVDVTPRRPSPPSMLVRELDGLPYEQRRVMVLSLVAGLTLADVSAVVGVGEPAVQQRLGLAVGSLESRRDVYGASGTLTEALHRAVPASGGDRGQEPESDRAHGRFLRRARRRRMLALTAAALAAVVLVGQGVGVFRSEAELGDQRPRPVASIVPPSFSTAPPPPPGIKATCATNYPPCDYQIVQQWRSEMRDVAVEYLDPEGGYFSSAYFDGDDGHERWEADTGGALTVVVEAESGTGTQVLLQIATSREFAARCGSVTEQRCIRQRFMDGNWLTLTESSYATEGIEVQFTPYDQVITVVAQNRGKGKHLAIDRGQLVALIEDPRLRLPALR